MNKIQLAQLINEQNINPLVTIDQIVSAIVKYAGQVRDRENISYKKARSMVIKWIVEDLKIASEPTE
jgi:hypothetical protein